jgi:predicted nucleotidyltransferase
MPDESNPADFEKILRCLTDEGVEFLVIGGQAEMLFGSPRLTYDTDICYRRTPDNHQRLARALEPLEPRLRGAPPGLPFRMDAKTLAAGCNFTLDTNAGPLDLLGFVEPIGSYEQLQPGRETYQISDATVETIGLDDLLRVKKHISRVKDRESLLQLLTIKKFRQSRPTDDGAK